jgi:hypothetical protein
MASYQHTQHSVTVISWTLREGSVLYHWKITLATEIPAVDHITNEHIVRDHTIRFNMSILYPLWNILKCLAYLLEGMVSVMLKVAF